MIPDQVGNDDLGNWRELDFREAGLTVAIEALSGIVVTAHRPLLLGDTPLCYGVRGHIRAATVAADEGHALAGLGHAASLPLPNRRSNRWQDGIGPKWVLLRRDADQDDRHGRDSPSLPNQVEQVSFVVWHAR